MDFSTLCRYPFVQDEICNLANGHPGDHDHVDSGTYQPRANRIHAEIEAHVNDYENTGSASGGIFPIPGTGIYPLPGTNPWPDVMPFPPAPLMPPPFLPSDRYPWREDVFNVEDNIVELHGPNDYPKGTVVTFSMYRGTDESGISGEGKVLDGVIFEDGLVVVRWVTVQASQSTVVYDCSAKEGQKPTTGFQKFLDIHVRAHPANNTVIEFHVPQKSKFVWTQPQGTFKVDQVQTEEAARYIMWAVQQPWFKWPEEKGND